MPTPCARNAAVPVSLGIVLNRAQRHSAGGAFSLGTRPYNATSPFVRTNANNRLPKTVSRLAVDGHAALSAEPRVMRRLRVSRALYLPSDLPLHGIFGSKDVIHS